jgi:hypothetical protein
LQKKLYFEKDLKANQRNLKKTWELIRAAANLPKMNKKGISQILIDGNLVSEPLSIATKFIEFSVSMPSLVVSEIIPPSHAPDPEPDNDEQLLNRPFFSFSNNPVTQSEIIDAFKLLKPKKLQDLNNVSMFLVSKAFYQILTPIHHVIKTSLMTGLVPSQLKIAKIIPIFKSGDRTIGLFRC